MAFFISQKGQKMRNKLITILSICAAFIISMCSVNLKTIDAAEEAPAAAASGETYSNNLFEKISYSHEEYSLGNVSYNYLGDLIDGNQDSYTNIMEFNNEKDILISMKFKLPDTIDTSKEVTATGPYRTAIRYLNSNFETTGSTFLSFYSYNFVKYECYKLDASGEYLTYNIIFKPESQKDAKYFMIRPYLSYENYFGEVKNCYGSDITDMYVSFVESETITSAEDLKTINIDYTPYDSGISWENDSVNMSVMINYLPLNVNNNYYISELVTKMRAIDSNGKKCEISYGSYDAESVYIPGGKYSYILKATSETGEVDVFVVTLHVKDLEGPVISGAKEYTVPNGSNLSIESIKKTLVVTDNVSNADNITITLKYDFFSENRSNPGSWYVCFIAKDEAGNISEDFIIKINVADKEAPVFYDANNVEQTKATVYKSTDSVLVLSDILRDLTAIDDVDGEREITIHRDNYTGNGETVGSYLVVLKATDTSGNVAYYNVNIIVSEKMPTKTILIDDKIILVEKNVKLNKQDFHGIIQMLGRYNQNTTNYTTINSEIYNISWNEVGDYIVDYSVISTAGYEDADVFIVRVIDSRTADSFVDNTKLEEKSWILSALEWLWNLILSFFEWIGSLFS